MAKAEAVDVYLNVRFPRALVERMDAAVLVLREKTPGANFTRSDVLRMAVEQFVRSVDGQEEAPRPQKKVAGRR